MGRTLHFEIKKENGSNFNDKEIDAMQAVSIRYNSGKLKDAWSCENFWVTPLDYLP